MQNLRRWTEGTTVARAHVLLVGLLFMGRRLNPARWRRSTARSTIRLHRLAGGRGICDDAVGSGDGSVRIDDSQGLDMAWWRRRFWRSAVELSRLASHLVAFLSGFCPLFASTNRGASARHAAKPQAASDRRPLLRQPRTSMPRPQPWGSPTCRDCRMPFGRFVRDSSSRV